MNGRSTRDKIRWNVWRAADRIMEAMGNLKHVEDLAEGRSPLVNEHMPQIITAMSQLHETLRDFRDEL